MVCSFMAMDYWDPVPFGNKFSADLYQDIIKIIAMIPSSNISNYSLREIKEWERKQHVMKLEKCKKEFIESLAILSKIQEP